MKKNHKSRKGFTIVELVIVIAVIAILAGVLIPTFSNVITKANDSAALQRVTNAYKEAYAIALSNDGQITSADKDIVVDSFEFDFTDAKNCTITCNDGTLNGSYDFAYEGGKMKVTGK